MADARDNSVVLEELVIKLKSQADQLKGSESLHDQGQLYAYYDVLSFMRDQAKVLGVDASEIGLDFDIDALLLRREAA